MRKVPFESRSEMPNSRPDLVVSAPDSLILLSSVFSTSGLTLFLAVFVCFPLFIDLWP